MNVYRMVFSVKQESLLKKIQAKKSIRKNYAKNTTLKVIKKERKKKSSCVLDSIDDMIQPFP
jgi:hypothetical protein